MVPLFVTLELVLHKEPAEAVQQIKEAVQRGGGLITNATRFSNKALSFQVEIEARHLASLGSALDAIGSLATEGKAQLERLSQALANEAEVQAFLHVTLVHSAPDERVETPKVPG